MAVTNQKRFSVFRHEKFASLANPTMLTKSYGASVPLFFLLVILHASHDGATRLDVQAVRSSINHSAKISIPMLRPPVEFCRLRGGGKRGRDESAEESKSSPEKKIHDGEGDLQRATKRRRGWWSAGVLANSVVSGTMSALKWPAFGMYRIASVVAGTVLNPFSGQKRHDGNDFWRMDGDDDKTAAVRRQIAFYFSDSNLPTGDTAPPCHP